MCWEHNKRQVYADKGPQPLAHLLPSFSLLLFMLSIFQTQSHNMSITIKRVPILYQQGSYTDTKPQTESGTYTICVENLLSIDCLILCTVVTDNLFCCKNYGGDFQSLLRHVNMKPPLMYVALKFSTCIQEEELHSVFFDTEYLVSQLLCCISASFFFFFCMECK